MNERLLVVEDDTVQREILGDILTRARYNVTTADSGEAACEHLAADSPDLLLTDLKLPGMDGIELLRRAKEAHPDIEVVVMTAFATVQTAVTAMKEGACDYLAKPFDKDELLIVVTRALERGELRRENRRLKDLVSGPSSLGEIVGGSAPMQRVYGLIQRAIPVNSTVLIEGESGTGKELVARHIHFNGPRRNKPFVVVNCAAIPDTLIESELFGHEKGAFTGAETARTGKFEVANEGTLFLDEIGDMRLDAQAKLLRVLQDGTVERIGSSSPRKVDVRVIAATNRDLSRFVQEGKFREDLYFRLEVLPIRVPPLRERVADVPVLVEHFREKLAQRLARTAPTLGREAMKVLQRYSWPGNVRELENTLEQVFILADGETIALEDLPEKLRHSAPAEAPFHLPEGGVVLEDVEQDLIRQAMERSGGSIKEAAELLGLSYKTLQYRLKKHQIPRE